MHKVVGITVCMWEIFEGRNYKAEGDHTQIRGHIRMFVKLGVYTRLMSLECNPRPLLVQYSTWILVEQAPRYCN